MTTIESVNPDLYVYRVAWSPEDEEFVGTCAEFPSLSWLEPTKEAALTGIAKLVADTLEDLASSGEPIPEPLSTKTYSGTFTVRTSPILHRQLAIEAAEYGMSINRWVNSKLSASI
jgi:predicted HicB family RNase H-like nuclease